MKKIFIPVILIVGLNTIVKPQSDLSKIVFGYLTDWEYLESNHTELKYDHLTHLACFPFTFDNLGHISISTDYPVRWPWNDVIDSVRTNNIKLIMSVAEFDSSKIRIVLHDNAVKHQLITDIKRVMNEYSFDGVNIDFEPLNDEDEGQPIIDFMHELTDSIHQAFPGSEVSFDTPVKNWNDDWDFNELADACDYLFIMGYNYFGSWSGPGPTSPLTSESWSSLNLTWAMANDYSEAIQYNSDKLILGLPYFGEHWTTTTETANDADYDYSYVSYVPFRDLETYSNNMEELWSELYNTSWFRWQDTTWHQIWIDTKESLGKKYDLMLSHNLAGVGIWSLGLDKGKNDYWELIEEKIGGSVGIENIDEIPDDILLMQNYPNPFNPTTTIKYELPKSGMVTLTVYDVLGREIKQLVNSYKEQGKYSVVWNAINNNGQLISNGIYIYQLRAGQKVINRKMIFLK